jgi:type I restriction enzyme S subunit
MSEPFKEYRWGELLEIIKTPVEMKDDDVFPLASIRRRNGGFFHRETKLGRDILTKTLSKAVAGTFAISRMQVVHGACSYVSESFSDSFLSASYTQFQAKSPSKVDIKYLHYFAHTRDSYNAFLMSSHGVHIEKLTFDLNDWLKRKVRLPPLPEQKKIASILTSVDEVIENTQKQIDKLQDLKKASMNELLTKGIGHTEFKDSELGRIPKSWEVTSLGEVTVESAFGPRFSSDFYSEEGNIGCIRTTDIDKNWNINYDTIPTAKLSIEQFRSHILKDGDMLVTRSGTCGLVDIFKEQRIPMIAGAFLIRFRLKKNMDPLFLRLVMMDEKMQERVQGLASGGVQKNLSGTNLKSLPILRPELDEQRRIISLVESITTAMSRLFSKLSQTQSLKKSLMQDLLTGKVRVTVN